MMRLLCTLWPSPRQVAAAGLVTVGLASCSDDMGGPIPPPSAIQAPATTGDEEPAKPQADEAQQVAPVAPLRGPAWGDGTTELRRDLDDGSGTERTVLVGVTWVGPSVDGNSVEEAILFNGGSDLVPDVAAPELVVDGIDAFPDLIPSYLDGGTVGPHASVTPFVRCELVGEHQRCRPCDVITADPGTSTRCWDSQADFETGVWQALATRMGLTVAQVQAVPHTVAVSQPFIRGDFAVGVCKQSGGNLSEYRTIRNDRVLKDTKVIAFAHAGIDGSNRVVRRVVRKADAGFPHQGGLLVQTTGFAPLMQGAQQVPGPYAVGTWCQAASAWCNSLDDGCRYSVQDFSYTSRAQPASAQPASAQPASTQPASTDPGPSVVE